MIQTELREFMHFYGYAMDNRDESDKWPQYTDQTADEQDKLFAYRKHN